MGKQKPRPYVLRLKHTDVQRCGLRNVVFTPAHFDHGKDVDEHWIVTSTGPYIVKWNFRKLKKAGIVNSYSIRRGHSTIVHNQFKYNGGQNLLVSEKDNVYTQHSVKGKQ